MEDPVARTDPFVGDPQDTRELIMEATLRPHQEHGFAGLLIGRIADEADLSNSVVYHFFVDNDDLMLSPLDPLLAHFGSPTSTHD